MLHMKITISDSQTAAREGERVYYNWLDQTFTRGMMFFTLYSKTHSSSSITKMTRLMSWNMISSLNLTRHVIASVFNGV